MLKFLLLVVVLFALAFGFHTLSNQPGEVSLTIGDTVYAVSLTTAVISAIVLVLVAMGLIWFVRGLLRAPQGFAPIAIGLGLTLVNLVGIPVTNMSVNPARSTGPALMVGGWALAQLWLFWIAPIVGGALGGGIYRVLFADSGAST